MIWRPFTRIRELEDTSDALADRVRDLERVLNAVSVEAGLPGDMLPRVRKPVPVRHLRLAE